LILLYGYRQYKIHITDKLITKYLQIENYEDAKILFDTDFKNNDLKYFYFGLAYNDDFDSIKIKYRLKVVFMGDIIEYPLNMYNHIIEKEIIKEQIGFIPSNKADSIWQNFMIALETKQIDYLLNNSFDSIHCSELNDTTLASIGDKYDAKFIFENYLNKLMHLKNLSTQKSHIFYNDSIIRIQFPIKSKAAEEDGYDLIFMFNKSDNKYLFSGMLLT
jgi:hypothetical protein